MPSEAQKRASNKYNLEHMTTLGCKVKKNEAYAFKEFCAAQGKTSNTVLKEYVLSCIKKQSVNKSIDEKIEHDTANND